MDAAVMRLLIFGLSTFALLFGGHAAVFSASTDSEIAELHSTVADSWTSISNLTEQLQTVGAISSSAPGLPSARPMTGMGPALGSTLPVGGRDQPDVAGGSLELHAPHKVPRGKLDALRAAQGEFQALQQTAFKIGRESSDNAELAQHPEVNNYLQGLRTLAPKLQDLISDLEREYQLATGQEVDKSRKKKKKQTKKIQGLSEEEIRARTSQTVLKDDRTFSKQAVDLVSSFRERQLQMQDKQHDLQLTMDGPDWPKEDWPLTTDDAKHVGEAETMISGALAELNTKINPIGGLARVHESGDKAILQQLAALSEMMSGYCELIERHVDTVKRTMRGKPKTGKQKKRSKQSQASAATPSDLGGASLRDRLLNFGQNAPASTDEAAQPFAWLREKDSGGDAKISPSMGFGSLGSVGSSLGSIGSAPGSELGSATLGSTFGRAGSPSGLATFGSLGAASASQAFSNSGTSFGAVPGSYGGFAQPPTQPPPASASFAGASSAGLGLGSFGGYGASGGSAGFSAGGTASAGLGSTIGSIGGLGSFGAAPAPPPQMGLGGSNGFGSAGAAMAASSFPSGGSVGGFGTRHPTPQHRGAWSAAMPVYTPEL